MNVINTIKSKKNNNEYLLFADKIVIKDGLKKTELELPEDPSTYRFYQQFHDMYYIEDKLFAIVATGSSYDYRFEFDEDNLELKYPPIQTY